MSDETKETKEAKDNGVSAKTLTWVAIGLIAMYLVGVVVLYRRADMATGDTWARYIVLLTGVESIVFAAVGWLFGREVNRQRAEVAEKDKEKAQDAAAEAQEAEQKSKEELVAAQETNENLQAAIGTARDLGLQGAPTSGNSGDQMKYQMFNFKHDDQLPAVSVVGDTSDAENALRFLAEFAERMKREG